MNDLLSNLAPAIVGLTAAALGLAYGRSIARASERARAKKGGLSHPAE